MNRCRCPQGSSFVYDPKATRERRQGLGDCIDPNVLSCQGCATSMAVPCGATREDRCEGCGKRHNRRLKRLIGSGFADKPTGLFFGTGTAPGSDVLPWDESVCNHSADLACSGKLGCKVERVAAAMWNGAAPQVWSWLMTEIRRLLPGVDVQFWKCWETQDRGMLHMHAIIRANGVSAARMAKVWSEALDTAYSVNGYRFVWGKQRTLDAIGSKNSVSDIIDSFGMSPDEALEVLEVEDEAERLKFLRYGAKYCTKGGRRASTVNRRTGEIRDDGAGYRTWSASSRWGATMKQIRAAQRAWIESQAAGVGGSASDPHSAAGSEATLDTSMDIYAGVGSLVLDFDSTPTLQPL